MSHPEPEPPSAPGLLIALTGAPGSGKTRLLAELAAWQRARGGKTDGFLAAAGERSAPDKGAGDYQLKMLASGETLPWAVRDESLNPPYRFDEITFYRLQDWANRLAPPPRSSCSTSLPRWRPAARGCSRCGRPSAPGVRALS